MRPSVLLLGLLLAACGQQQAPTAVARPRPELQQVQREMSGARLVHQRRDVINRVRDDLPRLLPQILAGIADPKGPLFESSAELAAELRVVEAVEQLLEVARDPSSPYRAAALRAAHRIQPVALPLLVQLLDELPVDDDDERLAHVALRALLDCDGVPFATVARWLAAADPQFAGAAAAVLPMELSTEQIEALARLEFGSVAAGVAVIDELGQRALPAAVLGSWQRRLPALEAEAAVAVLSALRARPELIEPELLRQVVLGSGAPTLRFEALRCLLAAKAVRAEWLLAHCGELPRALRMLCGLGLLQLEHKEGARILFALAYGDDGQAEPAPPGGAATAEGAAGEAESDAVAITARRLLTRLSDLPLNEGEDGFASWCAEPKVAHRDALVYLGPAAPLCEPTDGR